MGQDIGHNKAPKPTQDYTGKSYMLFSTFQHEHVKNPHLHVKDFYFEGDTLFSYKCIRYSSDQNIDGKVQIQSYYIIIIITYLWNNCPCRAEFT